MNESEGRCFAITASPQRIRLDRDRKGDAFFTVTSTRGTRRARAIVEPRAPADGTWFELVGPPERTYEGTEQFRVRIQAPPEAKSGSYSFRLRIASEANPDEDFADGPWLAFDVPSELARQGAVTRWFWLWWSIATIVGLLVGTAVFALLLESVLPVGTTAGARITSQGLFGLCLGGGLGVMQWLLLRRHLGSAVWWILATTLGAAVGMGVGQRIGEAHLFGRASAAILFAFGLGLSVAVPQLLFLYTRVNWAGAWLGAVTCLFLLFFAAGEMTGRLGAAIVLLPLVAATGWLMAFLLQHPKREDGPLPKS